MKYLILDNIEAFNICNQIAGGYYNYPNEVGTQRYADPIHHLDGIQAALPIFDVDNTEILWNKYLEMFGEMPVIVDSLSPDWYPQDSLEMT